MDQKVIRLALGAAVLGIALASVDIGPKTYGKSEQHVQLISFAWGVDKSQYTRICIGNGVGAPESRATTETFSMSFVAIKFESGVTAHETELQVPFGQYRCTDLSYQSLVESGLSPESNSALKFFVNIRTRSSASGVGETEAVTVGAAQNIDVGTGEMRLNQPFRVGPTRQVTIVQDV